MVAVVVGGAAVVFGAAGKGTFATIRVSFVEADKNDKYYLLPVEVVAVAVAVVVAVATPVFRVRV